MRWWSLLLLGGALGFSLRRDERSVRDLSLDRWDATLGSSESWESVLLSPPLDDRELVEWTLGERDKEKCLTLHNHGLVDYCTLIHSLKNFSIPLLILWVLLLLWLLNDTAETYFVPPLQYWSSRLRLSPCMAGATLVAAGNGAPDLVMTVLAPTTLESLHIVICDTLCILCVAGGAVLYLRSRIAGTASTDGKDSVDAFKPLDARSFAGSAAWLCCALAYLMVLLGSGYLSLAGCAVMPALYIGFLATLAALDDGAPCEVPSPEGPPPPLTGLTLKKDATCLETLRFALTMPTYVLRWMLIPPSDFYWDRSRRIYVSASPIAMLVFIAWIAGLSFGSFVRSPWCMFALFVAISLSTFLLVFTSDGPDMPKLYPLTTLLAKVSSVLLLLAIARELTACFKTVAFSLGMSRMVLESTVLPWGNSLGDLVTAIAMVRQGQGAAAATALFASPLFNLLLSAGLTLIIATSNEQVITFGFGAARQMLVTGAAFLACMMLCAAMIFEKQVAPFGAAGLAGLYIIFLVSVVVQELHSGP